jgi:NAD(P)-dependent dehydrogenase (short-subunit alcohol dehydrogenase family)
MGRSEATRRSDTPTRTPRRSALWMTIPTGLVLAAAMGAVPDPGTPTTASQEEGVAMGWDRASPVALVTGSTGGLGREVALRLGGEGYHVIVHGRNRERGMEVVRAIEEAGPGTASLHVADLASLEETRALARAVLEGYDRLDVLVNNAGIWLEPEAGRVLNEDGHELHFHVNYLAHFLLTELLLDRVVASAPSRIVHVSSVAQRAIDFDDVMLEEGYSDGRAYAQSKLAQILHTYDLARDLEGTGVTVNALHPATMMDTDMVLARGAQPRASVEEGVEAALNLILSPGVEHGRYYNGLTPVRANDQAYDAEARARLRTLSLRLTGLEP